VKTKIIPLLVVIFSLFGTTLIPQSFAGGTGTPVSASECPGPSQVSILSADLDPTTGVSIWIISDFLVSLDSNFGPWQKNLVPESGVPIQVGNPQILFDVEETIMVGPGISFTDWHEVIVTPDWIWQVGSTSITPQGTIIENGNEISITFDNPVNPGDLIEITKTLQYVGQGSEISNANPLVLMQNPTSVICDDDVVGGELIPVEITSLALAGVQTNAIWILTLLITIGGAGLFYFKIK